MRGDSQSTKPVLKLEDAWMKIFLGIQDAAGEQKGHLAASFWLTKGLCLHPHTQRWKANENLGTSRRMAGPESPFIPRVCLSL